MSSSKYNHYVESSVKWLGEIPNHWNIKKFQDLASTDKWSIVDGPFGSDLKNEEYTDSGVPLIQLNNIIPGQHIFNGMKFVSEEKANDLIRHNAYPGDIVLAKMADPVARAAVVKSDYSRYVIVADCIRLSVNKEIANSRFAVYAINAHYFKCNAIAMSSGITRVRINMGELKRLKIALPPLIEQNSIANFLDSETTKIDELSKAFEGLIATLKEKRQAVISHAVTKGLDPSVPMKDSGVEWVGQVPNHWTINVLKHLTTKITDGEHIAPIALDEGVRLLSAKDVRDRRIDYDVDKFVSESDAATFWRKCKPELNDVLIVSRGATVGRIGVVENDIDFCLMGSVILCKLKSKFDADFIYYALNAKHAQTSLWFSSASSAQQAIYIRDVAEIPMPIPPIKEMVAIANFLNIEVGKIETLTNEALFAVHLLKERRNALISAAVTGKIDVRGLVNINKEEKIKEAA